MVQSPQAEMVLQDSQGGEMIQSGVTVESFQDSPSMQQSTQGAPMQSSQDQLANQMQSSPTEHIMQSPQDSLTNQSPQSELVLQTIKHLNSKGELLAQITYDEVVALLTKVGDEKATRLLNMLDERASTIRDPTGWLKVGAANALNEPEPQTNGFPGPHETQKGFNNQLQKGKGAPHFGKGAPQFPYKGCGKGLPQGGAMIGCPLVQLGNTWVEASPWVSRKIATINEMGLLQQPINQESCTALLSVIPEGTALGFLKELEEKAREVPDPTAWVVDIATRYCEGMMRGQKFGEGSVLSRKIGMLNKSGRFAESICWTDVAGPLLFMDEADAVLLVDELEQKAPEIHKPTTWLKGAAERRAKLPRHN